MNSSDYIPGEPITTQELLRDMLEHEDAVFLHGAYVESTYFRKYVSPGWPRADTCDGRFRRALVRCPQSAAEMRANTERDRP